MELFLFITALAGLWVIKQRDQRRRIQLLGSFLGRYDIEKLMEGLTAGYMRALGESSHERQAQVWSHLNAQEERLRDQLRQFAADIATAPEITLRTSKLPIYIPLAELLASGYAFDVRKVISVHANGVAQVVANVEGRSPKDRAYMLLAELFLLQHSCHWFCRSKMVASARLLARHQSPYAQVLASVSPATRKAYQALVG